MIGKLDPEERVMSEVLPDWFAQTSDEPYDRHQYLLESKGSDALTFDDYEQMRAYWFQSVRNRSDCTVTVLDKKQQHKKSHGGFK